jgi:hypothetical protein
MKRTFPVAGAECDRCASAHASGSSGMTVKAGCFNAIPMNLAIPMTLMCE